MNLQQATKIETENNSNESNVHKAMIDYVINSNYCDIS